LRSTIEESEFRRGLRASCLRGEDDSVGSANMSSSPVGRGLLYDDPDPATLRARIASSCERDGR
jgi:hypothetical protein